MMKHLRPLLHSAELFEQEFVLLLGHNDISHTHKW